LVGGFFGKPRSDCPVPELLCEEVTPEAIAERLVPLFAAGPRREGMLAYLALVRNRLIGDHGRAGASSYSGGPSRVAAREVLSVASRGAAFEEARGAAGETAGGTIK
jgi:hypothetical protein